MKFVNIFHFQICFHLLSLLQKFYQPSSSTFLLMAIRLQDQELIVRGQTLLDDLHTDCQPFQQTPWPRWYQKTSRDFSSSAKMCSTHLLCHVWMQFF